MKKYSNRILSFILAAILFGTSFLCSSYTVYASQGGVLMGRVDLELIEASDYYLETGDSSKLIEVTKSRLNIFKAIALSCGAFATGDALSYITASEAVLDCIPGNLTADEDGIHVGADLVAQIKQALIEYADETNPFILEETYNMYEIPASTFRTKAAYDAFRSYCSSHHFTVALPQCSVNYMYLADATPYIKDGGAFVSSGNMVVVINSDWKVQLLPYDYYQLKVVDGNDIVDITENRGEIQWIAHYDPKKTNFGVYNQNPFIVTPDGGRIRVFKSVTEFMNYDAGQRKVYFGSGFYDFDPTDITATWDEINDKIGRMDDILQDILDAIDKNPNLSEEDLEKLIDELIGKIGEIGGEIGGSIDETNSLLGGIASSLSGYFSSVLDYLEQILEAIEALVWIEAGEDEDDGMSDLFDIIDKIWKDPETGSQEAADTLSGSFAEIASGITKKFPFSIPWDIYNLFRVFSGAPSPDEATFHTMTLGVEPFTVDNEDLEQDIHEAPYFKLPLRLDSYGIYEEVVIDLADFKTVSTLSRGLLSVLFAVFLIKFTIRIIELFKGGSSE